MTTLRYIVRIARRHNYHRTPITAWLAVTGTGISVELLVAKQALSPGNCEWATEPYQAKSTDRIECVGTVGCRVWESSLVSGMTLTLWVPALLPTYPSTWKRLLSECSDLKPSEWRGLLCLA